MASKASSVYSRKQKPGPWKNGQSPTPRNMCMAVNCCYLTACAASTLSCGRLRDVSREEGIESLRGCQ